MQEPCLVVTFFVSLLITSWTWWWFINTASIAKAAHHRMEEAKVSVLVMRDGTGSCASAVNRFFEAQVAYEQADAPMGPLAVAAVITAIVTLFVGSFMAETCGWFEHHKQRREHGV